MATTSTVSLAQTLGLSYTLDSKTQLFGVGEKSVNVLFDAQKQQIVFQAL